MGLPLVVVEPGGVMVPGEGGVRVPCVRGETLCCRGGEKVGLNGDELTGPGEGWRVVVVGWWGAALRASAIVRGELTVEN